MTSLKFHGHGSNEIGRFTHMQINKNVNSDPFESITFIGKEPGLQVCLTSYRLSFVTFETRRKHEFQTQPS